MKIIYFDSETTGLDPRQHAMIQMAGQVFVDGELRESFDLKARPRDGQVIDTQALEIQGRKLEEIILLPDPMDTHLAFHAILDKYVDKFDKTDKFFLVGYNVRFDEDFLREFFRLAGDKYYGSYFWTPSIDVMALAAACLIEERFALPNFKLGTVAAHLGIQPDGELHDAAVDIDLTRRLMEAILVRRKQ